MGNKNIDFLNEREKRHPARHEKRNQLSPLAGWAKKSDYWGDKLQDMVGYLLAGLIVVGSIYVTFFHMSEGSSPPRQETQMETFLIDQGFDPGEAEAATKEAYNRHFK